MSVERTCSECGAEIPSDSKQGLCTRCLLTLGLKAGGGDPAPPLQSQIGNQTLVSIHDESAETLFERRWAMTLLDQVMERLRADYTAAGKSELFAALQGHLSGAERLVPYAELGARLKMTEGAVKTAVSRLRKRYGELLRAEIAGTVCGPGEVEEEIRNLIIATSE